MISNAICNFQSCNTLSLQYIVQTVRYSHLVGLLFLLIDWISLGELPKELCC